MGITDSVGRIQVPRSVQCAGSRNYSQTFDAHCIETRQFSPINLDPKPLPRHAPSCGWRSPACCCLYNLNITLYSYILQLSSSSFQQITVFSSLNRCNVSRSRLIVRNLYAASPLTRRPVSPSPIPLSLVYCASKYFTNEQRARNILIQIINISYDKSKFALLWTQLLNLMKTLCLVHMYN